MPEVKLSLAEVDEFRDKIKLLEATNSRLELDKMEVKITTIPKSYHIDIDDNKLTHIANRMPHSIWENEYKSNKSIIMDSISVIQSEEKDHLVEYKNLDSVKEFIYKDCENKVQDKVNSLTKKSIEWEKKVSIIEEQNRVNSIKINNENKSKIANLHIYYKEITDKLEESINQLNSKLDDKKEKSKIQMLTDKIYYYKELSEFNSRSWFYRWVNSNEKPILNDK